MKSMKKFMAVLLAAVMLFGLIPTAALAAEAPDAVGTQAAQEEVLPGGKTPDGGEAETAPEPSADTETTPSSEPSAASGETAPSSEPSAANGEAAPSPEPSANGEAPAAAPMMSPLLRDAAKEQIHVAVRNDTYAGAPFTGLIAEGYVDVTDDLTMMSAVLKTLQSAGYTWEGTGGTSPSGLDVTYIGGIFKDGESLEAFDGGYLSGWMGTLNDWFTNEGYTAFTVAKGTLEADDEIVFMYTCDMNDLGGTTDNNDKTLKAVATSVGTLSPAFSSEVKEYTLTLPAGTNSLKITPTATNKNFEVRASVDGTEYKRTKEIPVADGTVIKLTCGKPEWPSMNNQAGNTGYEVPEEVYTLNVETAQEYNTPPARKAGVPASASATVGVGSPYALDLSTIFEDAENDALTYRVSVDGAAAVSAAGSYTFTPSAAGTTTLVFTANDGKADSADTYTVTLKATTAESTLQEAIDALKWYKITPVCGTDTNVVDIMKAKLAKEGYGEIGVTLESSDDEAHVAADGTITYFYDLNSYVNVANVDVVFTFALDGVTKEYTQRVIVGWDTVRAAETIETTEANTITWDTIRGENTAQDHVTADLTLPLFAGAAYGSALSNITWKSSNTDVISITANGNSWDYEPSTGTVTKPEADTNVTLTATFTFKKDSACKVEKTFDLTVKGYTPEEIEQKKTEMLGELDQKYTADLLKDFTSQSQLDCANVADDIQLPIPSRIGLVNKEIAVSSSNTDVVTINGYRAYVVCPLDTDAQVDLIVTLTRGSLSVEKRIPLTVKAIASDEEIDREIELMEAVKAAYFDGINDGINADKDHVTANLHSFREVNFAADGSLVWSYDINDGKGTGIRPVDINPDDQMGEAGYRLFKSSNAAVVAHENLLVKQPAEDTQVTISSVLSSTKFEKYAEQYPENEKLQKLYRQPVSVTVTVKATMGEEAVLADITQAVEGVSISGTTGLYVRETDWDENYDDVEVTNVEQTWQLRMKRTDIAVSVIESSNANIAADGAVSFTDEKVAGNVNFRFTKDGVSYEKEVLVTVPVHTKTLQEQIDSLSALFGTEAGFDLIRGSNSSKDAITQPLNLQKTASSYALSGYSDVEMLWTSSNTDVINPPSYGSGSVKVVRPENGQPDAQVDLTVTVKKGSYASGSATPKTATISVTVPAVTDDELAEAKNAVDAALANVTLTGFTESSSLGEAVIDPAALDYDIQLKSITDLISAGMVEDNAVNRSMTWAWSTDGTADDGNYLSINYLKCNVMRTVGTADKDTNLILTLTYNGYSGEKAFPVTIKGFTQDDVDAANAELKDYEAAIWEGLKGKNTDPDFITHNLGWDRENDHVVFYRIHREDGNFVYTLKNSSAPGNTGVEFDSWKSSDPTVIGQSTDGYVGVDLLQLKKRPNFGEEAYSVSLNTNMTSLRYKNVKDADGGAAVPAVAVKLEMTVPAFTNELKSLSVENAPFDFDPAKDGFVAEVPKGTAQVKVTAAAKDSAARVTIGGQEPDENGSATVTLSGASTQIPVITTVQDQEKTVTLTVNYQAAPILSEGSYTRASDTEGAVVFTTNKDGSAYIALAEKGAAQPQISTAGDGTAVTAGKNTIPTEGLTAGAKDIYVAVKDKNGEVSEPLKVEMAAYADLSEKLIEDPQLSTGIFWTPMFEKGRAGNTRFAYTHVPTGTETFAFTFGAPEGVEIYDSKGAKLDPNADGTYSMEIAVTSDADGQMFVPDWLMGKGGQAVTFEMRMGGQTAEYRLNVVRRNLGTGFSIVDYFCIGSQYTNNGNYGLYPERIMEDGTDWNTPISIGGFGGYITFKADEPIVNDPNNPYGIDFVIYGNGSGQGFSEPGNVLVSEDGNTWYMLAGSDYFDDNTEWDYKLTYSSGDDNKIHWTDMHGNTGTMTLGQHPPKNENYPMATFDPTQPITVTGALLKSQAKDQYGTAAAAVPDWGYVDAQPNRAGNPYSGDSKTCGGGGFDLSWAVDADGNPVQIDKVNYVKVMTASHIDGGGIGEKSTEVNAFLRVTADGAAVGKTAEPANITINGRAVKLKAETYEYGAYFGEGAVAVDVDAADGANVYINNAYGASRTYEEGPEKGIIRVVVQEGEKEPLIYYITEQTKEEALAAARTEAKAELDGYKDADDYRTAEKQELAQAIADGYEAIDSAVEFDGIDSAVTAAKAKMDGIKTNAQLTEEENIAAAKAADDKIDAIGTVTLESKAKIDVARAAYDALNADQKALVTKYDALVEAEAEYARLKAEADKIAADKAAAKGVDDLIDAIGEVALGSRGVIQDARIAYDALTAEQKAYVTGLDTLTEAENKWAVLNVRDLIDKISDTVTFADEDAIREAEEAYNSLTGSQKAETGADYTGKLTGASEEMAALVKNFSEAEVQLVATDGLKLGTLKPEDIPLTAEEKTAIAKGAQLKLHITLESVDEQQVAADAGHVKAALGSDRSIAGYLDIKVHKVVGDADPVRITELHNPLQLTLDVQDAWKAPEGTSRTFAVIRVHDGIAEEFADVDAAADTITFSNAKYSTHAVVYRDTQTDAGSSQTTQGTKSGNAVKTGDTQDIWPYLALVAAALGAVIAVLAIRRRMRKA